MSDTYAPVASPRDFLDGFTRVPRRRSAARLSEAQLADAQRYEARVAAATEFMADLLHGRCPAYYFREVVRPSSGELMRVIEGNYPGLFRPSILREGVRMGGDVGLAEAMSVSDFPLLMGDVLDRSLLRRFNAVPQVWRQYIDVGSPLRDFRTVRLLSTTGGNEEWDNIPDLGGIKYTSISESGITMVPKLYGKGMRLSWQVMQNDDLDAFRIIPDALAQGGRRTLNKFATDILFDANGPDASIFTTGKGNRLTSNPALSITSLGTALTTLMSFTDATGEPINVEGVRLIHGPGLAVVVGNILNALANRTTIAGGVTGGEIEVRNWLAQGITPVMDPYIPLIATTANAATSWILAADPGVGRPLARIRFLQGFEEPALYQKLPNTQRVGGGVDPNVGDFDSMSSEFKGLIAFGGVQIEDKAGVASNGSGA